MITDFLTAYTWALTFWIWTVATLLALATITAPIAALGLGIYRLRNTRTAWWLRTLPATHRTSHHTNDHHTPLT